MTTTAARNQVLYKKEAYLHDGLYTYYAMTWDAEKGEPVSLSLGGGYDGPSAEWASCIVDADAETVAAFAAWNLLRSAERFAMCELNRLMDETRAIHKGDHVEVVAGRKVAKGTQGRVFWIEDGGFGKVGIESFVDDARVVSWTYLKNVRRTDDADENLPDLAELREQFLAGAR